MSNKEKEELNGKHKPYLNRSLYFGNIEFMLHHKQEIEIKFISFEQKILLLIYLAFPVMLALENFGYRQNKGFGSFYISAMPPDEPDELEKVLDKKFW